jgi:hypothetical protein
MPIKDGEPGDVAVAQEVATSGQRQAEDQGKRTQQRRRVL